MDVGSDSPSNKVLYRHDDLDRLDSEDDREAHFQLLLDRGADPLRVCARNRNRNPLEIVATNPKNLVRVMLKSLDQRIIPLEKLQRYLVRAECEASSRGDHDDVIPLLHRFYWRKKYQNLPTHQMERSE